jgi:7-carboxy-7-deazaguanine synthase
MAVAYLSEVFRSIQGEGMHAGEAGVFVRFAGCNLACSYCDSPAARTRSATFSIQDAGGETQVANPFDCDGLVRMMVEDSDHPSLAVLTGGEPLLQAAALKHIIRGLKARGFSTYLETNGTLPGEMGEVRDAVDFVSMDIKLPSGQGGRDLSREHGEFLRVVRDLPAAVKIVIPGVASDGEILDAVRLVADSAPALPVFLQPVFRQERPEVPGERLLRLQTEASAMLRDVRISVQMHKILGIR